ncbi:MAG: TRAP transporter small permease [Marivita sp.]|uniref:TRAP transporter small permease n=1 Tax=Marivita sp. TaxID=2003365 RepID=UPI001B21D9CC|nr:TRAP transporter small permease [Marivita sp.]MBO6883141.1 TRAP transporter small permease [Marivita sp.]
MSIQSNSDGAASAAPLPIRLLYGLVWLGGALSSLLILVAFSFTIIAVFWRYVLSDPLRWPNDLTGWTLVALIMLGVSEAYRRGDHIAMDLATGHLSGKSRVAQAVWAHLSVLAFATVLGSSAWHMVHFAFDWQAYTSGSIEIPLWIPQAPLFIGSILLGLTALTKLLELLVNRRN